MIERQILVSCGIIKKGRKVLLVKRHPDSRSQANLWEISGGKVDFSEDPVRTLIREMKEELGIKIKINKLFDVASVVMRENGEARHVVFTCFLCSHVSGKIKTAGDLPWEWVDNDKLLKRPLTAGTKVLLKKYLSS